MTPAAFFAQADALPFAGLPELVGHGGLVVVAPHPDDESLGCGGLIALCLAARRAVHVVIVSDGTGSHPTSKAYPRDRLRDLRESEARTACRALGLDDKTVTFLRLADRAVPSEGADADRTIADIVACAQDVQATALAVTWRRDPHCDHQASYALARTACARMAGVRLLEYPVWGHTLPSDSEIETAPRGARLDITDVLERKRAAISAHRSQVTGLIDDDPFGFALAPEMIARFERSFEIFLESP